MRGERIIERYVTVQRLGSGYAAVEMVRVESYSGGSYWDVNQTGVGRYRTYEEAADEARSWSASDETPLKLEAK